MSGFREQRFPEGISYGSTGGPEWRTAVETRGNGAEKRVKEWPSPLWRFDARKGIVDETTYQELLAFFLAVAEGRAFGFRYKDPTDFSATGQQLDTSEASGVYYLRKTYTFSSYSFQRRIYKPVTGTVTMTLNGNPVTVLDAASVSVTGGQWDTEMFDDELWGGGDAGVVLDYTTGIITWLSSSIPGPGDTLLATFEFDVAVRFDVDHLEVTYEDFSVYNAAVPILEIRQR
jgi:uncharacterized protein (TIGR02217 family)